MCSRVTTILLLDCGTVLTVWNCFNFIVNRYEQLTEARPKITRRTYISVMDVLAQTGNRMLLIPMIAIAIPKTRHPPNLSANHPPGICVRIYP